MKNANKKRQCETLVQQRKDKRKNKMKNKMKNTTNEKCKGVGDWEYRKLELKNIL